MPSSAESWYLLVRDPTGGRAVVPLVPGQRVMVGRAPSCQIVVHDERASRQHAEIFPTAGGWAIRDLDSRNGTLLDGEPVVGDCPLEPGQTIAIGLTEIRCGSGESPPPTAETDAMGTLPGAPAAAGEPPAGRAAVPRRDARREDFRIVGSSPLLTGVLDQVGRVAATNATVLVRGESGTGKELVARALHDASSRRAAPFICLNCAALSETLLESELFGHEKGAFTGATDRKIGKFEAADGGTLMLDEIGEMSPAIQAKFLRALEGHPFERVGGSTPVQADVRVVAATNRNLEQAVSAGSFRRDLYFRLKVVEIVVPPLRQRPEDITELALYFLGRFAAETRRRIQGFTPEALEALETHRWPGNVRELRNCIERAVVLAGGERIEVSDLALSHLTAAGDTGRGSGSRRGPFVPQTIAEVERQHVLATLEAVGGNKTKAAAILGIERSTLERKLAKWARA
jgi:DNA-binding NtrC family response regulator